MQRQRERLLPIPMKPKTAAQPQLLEGLSCRHGQGALDQVGRRAAVVSEWAVRDGLARRIS